MGESSTHLIGLPLGCNGEKASAASFAYDSRDFTWILQISGETQEKFNEHSPSLSEYEVSPVNSARVPSAWRIR